MEELMTNEAKISIKVFVDKVKERVVYAEADHTFVDILFSFMTLPLGTIVRLLSKLDDDNTTFEALGSLNNLYQSLKDFPQCSLATEEGKFMLLNPKSLSYNRCRNLKLKIDDTKPTIFYKCPSYLCKGCFSICNEAKCNECRRLINQSFSYRDDFFDDDKVQNVCPAGVFVSGIATFIVTDDFSVMPFTAGGIFKLLTDLGITDTSHLEERTLDLDSEQMLFLLKMALSLDSPLTHLVFHKNNEFLNLVSLGQSTTSNECDFMNKKTSSKMVLEVYLQKSTGKLLFAEAKEDFAEFLFGFLSIPLGTVFGTLLNGASSISCMDNLFKSIQNLSVGRYLKSQGIKDMLVKPHFGQDYSSKYQIFPIKGTITTVKYFKGGPCLLKDPRINEVYLKQSMFFVTDDLVVTPSSSHLPMNTLNKMKVLLDDVEIHEISIGLEEGLKLLKASLQSKSTLTNSFDHQLKQ